jgi:hypothetical protein
VALSLDAFLLNGIQYAVLQRAARDGLLQKASESLLSDLARLEEQAWRAPVTDQPRIRELLTSLRARCERLIEAVSGLSSFRTLSLEQVRSAVSQVPLLRGECVDLIQDLESWLHIAKPFYSSRPSHSTAAVNDFLANLERSYVEEWTATNAVSP